MSGLDKKHRGARISVSVASSPRWPGQSSRALHAKAKLAEDDQGGFELQSSARENLCVPTKFDELRMQ
jgi:hypothetical protein